MTANMCRKHTLDTPKIPEVYPLCTLRVDGDQYSSDFFNAAAKCCTPVTIKRYQCWHYCEVDESRFGNWLDCVSSTLNTTWGSGCQEGEATRPTATVIATPGWETPTPGWETPTPGTPTPTPYSPYYPYIFERSVKGAAKKNVEISVGGVFCALLMVTALL